MPTIFEYLGIFIRFYSDDHEPIHIHALYQDAVVKVSFYIKNGVISKITYSAVKGEFSTSKMKDLKDFIEIYKYQIILKWNEFYAWNKKIKKQSITKKVK